MTLPLLSHLLLSRPGLKTYAFSLGNFAWDGFLAAAPRGRSGEKLVLEPVSPRALSSEPASLPGRPPGERQKEGAGVGSARASYGPTG